MDKKIRNILIVIFGIIFILAIPTVIFYSQGYRFDFETKKIIKTGGIAFRTKPKSCEVYLNDKLTNKTDFIFGEVFIKNLLPKKYNIKIKKPGFSTWEKNLEIKEKMVTEAKNIILFPEKPNFSILLSNVDDYFFSPDGNRTILKKNNENGWDLTLFNIENKEENLLLKDSDLKQKGTVNLSDIKWSFDSTKILLKVEIKNEIKYFAIDTLKENNDYIFSLDYLGKPKELLFNNQNSQELFFLKTTSAETYLYKTNFYQTSSLGLPIKNILAYALYENKIFYLSQEGFLNRSDLAGNNLIILNKDPFPIEKNVDYGIKILPNQKIFINNKKGLYFLDSKSNNFEKMLSSINELALSPSSKNIYFFDNYEIWLSDESLEKIVFLTRFSKKIGDIYWLNSDYLIFNTEEKIKVSEIDLRDKINMVELGNFENPKIFWSQTRETLYLLSGGNLYVLENLIP